MTGWRKIDTALCHSKPDDPSELYQLGPLQLEGWGPLSSTHPTGWWCISDTRLAWAVGQYYVREWKSMTREQAMIEAAAWVVENGGGLWGFSAWVDRILSS